MNNKCFIKLCLLVCLCLSYNNVQSQVEQQSKRPYIQNVTVDPETGEVTINWDLPDPFDYIADVFLIYWHEPPIPGSDTGNNIPIDTIVDPLARSYSFNYDDIKLKYPDTKMPDPRLTSFAFSVCAEEWTTTDTIRSLRAYVHYNTQLNSVFDECNAEIRLSWYEYQGWAVNSMPYQPFQCYRLMSIPEGETPATAVEIERIETQKDTSFVIRNVDANKTFTFYIETVRNDGLTATSYKTVVVTDMPTPPSFIIAESSQYNDDGYAEITFQLDPAAETFDYRFSWTSNPDFSWTPLCDTTLLDNSAVLTDIKLREQTSYYKLEAWHICKNNYTAVSNNATALWLTVKQEGDINLLQWDTYQKWNNSDVKFEINRQIANNNSDVIAVVTEPSPTVCKDDLTYIDIDGEICYWIKATPLSPNSRDEYAISNKVCIKPEPKLYIPQAFTPNSGDVNSKYKPTFTPVFPDEYMMILYDRTGAKVFETKNPDEGWDGRLINGKAANEGVYAYFMRYKTSVGRVVEKKGTFALIIKP